MNGIGFQSRFPLDQERSLFCYIKLAERRRLLPLRKVKITQRALKRAQAVVKKTEAAAKEREAAVQRAEETAAKKQAIAIHKASIFAAKKAEADACIAKQTETLGARAKNAEFPKRTTLGGSGAKRTAAIVEMKSKTRRGDTTAAT